MWRNRTGATTVGNRTEVFQKFKNRVTSNFRLTIYSKKMRTLIPEDTRILPVVYNSQDLEASPVSIRRWREYDYGSVTLWCVSPCGVMLPHGQIQAPGLRQKHHRSAALLSASVSGACVLSVPLLTTFAAATWFMVCATLRRRDAPLRWVGDAPPTGGSCDSGQGSCFLPFSLFSFGRRSTGRGCLSPAWAVRPGGGSF